MSDQPVDERAEADGVEPSDDERRAREAETAEAWERESRLALRQVYALIEAWEPPCAGGEGES